MSRFLQKLGVNETVSSVLMIAFGVAILLLPNLLERLIAIYLIVVGVVRLIPE